MLMMNWLGYLNEHKMTLIVAMSGAALADCLVLLTFRRYFRRNCLPYNGALDELKAEVASLRSEVLSLKALVEELSATEICKPQDAKMLNGEPRRNGRLPGFWGNSSSVLSLSSEGSYYDAVDDWLDARASGDRFAYRFEELSKRFAEVDSLLGQQNGQDAYILLKRIYDNDVTLRSDIGLLWRLAKVCQFYSNTFEKSDSRRKELVLEGRAYALKACEIDATSFEALRWAAVLIGLSTDFVGMKEKVKLGGQFKEYLDKAIAMQPSDFSLLHMRGRYSFAVANLSWLERKAASALFAAVPEGTIDEALTDFLAVEALKPGTWIDNLLFVAQCYLAKKDEIAAIKYLTMANELCPENDAEEESLKEVMGLLDKYTK